MTDQVIKILSMLSVAVLVTLLLILLMGVYLI